MTRPGRDAGGRRFAAPWRSPPPARHGEARSRVPPRPANPARQPPAPPMLAPQGRSLAGTFRMALLHPPVKRGDAAIAGRLVEHRITLFANGERLRIALLFHLECVESGAQHEHELVAQHLADGAQFAVIEMA